MSETNKANTQESLPAQQIALLPPDAAEAMAKSMNENGAREFRHGREDDPSKPGERICQTQGMFYVHLYTEIDPYAEDGAGFFSVQEYKELETLIMERFPRVKRISTVLAGNVPVLNEDYKVEYTGTVHSRAVKTIKQETLDIIE